MENVEQENNTKNQNNPENLNNNNNIELDEYSNNNFEPKQPETRIGDGNNPIINTGTENNQNPRIESTNSTANPNQNQDSHDPLRSNSMSNSMQQQSP